MSGRPWHEQDEGGLPPMGELTGRGEEPELVREELRAAVLGTSPAPRRRQGDDLPDVTGWREALGGELAP